jgi:hypothetical protein
MVIGLLSIVVIMGIIGLIIYIINKIIKEL